MINTDRSCQNALNQCLYLLHDVQRYTASQKHLSTDNIDDASRSTRLAIDTFVREQKAQEIKRQTERVKTIIDQQKARKQREQSIFASIHARFQSDLVDLKA